MEETVSIVPFFRDFLKDGYQIGIVSSYTVTSKMPVVNIDKGNRLIEMITHPDLENYFNMVLRYTVHAMIHIDSTE